MTALAQRLDAVHARIVAACAAAGRDPAGVALVAVSKFHPAASVREALAAGQRAFGENRVQELAAKARELADAAPVWHMVGSVQTNKVADLVAVPGLALLHSLDRHKLADALQVRVSALGSHARLPCLVQVCATAEPTKHGLPPHEVLPFLRAVAADCPALDPCGLMAMGPAEGDPRPAFEAVARLAAQAREATGLPLPVLSLGMSGDLEAAIAAGSTMVRVGTDVFGPRPATTRAP